jgi:cation diffusion facilitator CzcD-associated flavoprotein CzcO
LGLTNNVSTPLLETSLTPFPAGTPDYVSHEVLCDYIKDVAKKSGVDNLIKFNTDVRSIKEIGGKWTVETITLQRDQADSAASFKRIVTVREIIPNPTTIPLMMSLGVR